MSHQLIQRLIWIGLVGLTMLTHRYVAVWESDVTLWRYAAARAPLKPRVVVNAAAARRMAGDREGADRLLAEAEVLLMLPHVPLWDREDAAAQIAALRGLPVFGGP